MFPLKDNIPTERFPVITVALIAINVFVFLFLQHPSGFSSVDDQTVVKYGAIPYALTHPGKHCGLGDRVTPDGVLITSRHGTVACEGKVVQTAEGDKSGLWTSVISAAVFILDPNGSPEATRATSDAAKSSAAAATGSGSLLNPR